MFRVNVSTFASVVIPVIVSAASSVMNFKALVFKGSALMTLNARLGLLVKKRFVSR